MTHNGFHVFYNNSNPITMFPCVPFSDIQDLGHEFPNLYFSAIVNKQSVVELSGKDQQIALAEYSRLVVLFLVLGQYLTQLWQAGRFFRYLRKTSGGGGVAPTPLSGRGLRYPQGYGATDPLNNFKCVAYIDHH